MNYLKLSKAISAWIKSYVLDYNLSSLVIGVSGGIDSAVSSTLAAMTGLPTYSLSMPIRQKSEQMRLANAHIDWLIKHFPNVKKYQVDLTATFDEMVQAFSDSIDAEVAQNLHAQANSRSRLRMVTLYHVAAAHKGIVVGTGNKVEDYGIGFFTKYGDGGVDIAPIADLYKSEVYALARNLNIISEIQTAPPTDGLWDDERSDVDQIGCTYGELEAVMQGKKNIDNEYAEAIFSRFHDINQHKMKPIPTFMLTEHGFGTESDSSTD